MAKSAYHFFLSHAGYSYDPKTETPLQGRQRCARDLAYHEKRARDANCMFRWEIDRETTSADWIADDMDGGRNCDPWPTWSCVAYDAQGKVFASLGGVDFGRDGDPFGKPYRRVIEAELACELPIEED
jgi:hypothetical protein